MYLSNIIIDIEKLFIIQNDFEWKRISKSISKKILNYFYPTISSDTLIFYYRYSKFKFFFCQNYHVDIIIYCNQLISKYRNIL